MGSVNDSISFLIACCQCVLQITEKWHRIIIIIIIIIIVLFCIVVVVCIRAASVIGHWPLSSARK
jgi:hypothetical protein